MLCAAGLSSYADGSQDLMHASPRTVALPLSHTPALKLQLLVNGDSEAWREQSFQVRRMNKLSGPFCDFQGQEGDQKKAWTITPTLPRAGKVAHLRTQPKGYMSIN